MARRTRLAAVLTLAMINVFTLAAGITVARMLPPRLAALKVPTVAAKPVSQAGPVLAPANRDGTLPTANGLRSALAGPLSAAALGPPVSAVVADPASGTTLWSQDPDQLATPASTTKPATSAAALAAPARAPGGAACAGWEAPARDKPTGRAAPALGAGSVASPRLNAGPAVAPGGRPGRGLGGARLSAAWSGRTSPAGSAANTA